MESLLYQLMLSCYLTVLYICIYNLFYGIAPNKAYFVSTEPIVAESTCFPYMLHQYEVYIYTDSNTCPLIRSVHQYMS